MNLIPILLLSLTFAPQDGEKPLTYRSGAPMPKEQAAFDVLHYGLSLRVDPEEQSIEGVLSMRARVLHPTTRIALDLDNALTVHGVTSAEKKLRFQHEDGRIWIDSPTLFSLPDQEIEVSVFYGGKPRVAPRPPWDGGFTWAETEKGEPWIATSCQGEGADLWWPCKDQPSDEPETMDLYIEVPKGLVVASNGRLVSEERSERGWRVFHWHVSTPINNYGVALNIAPYKTVVKNYESVAGETFPVTYWVLPENLAQGKKLHVEILEHMRFFEETFGPYPFRADKYGVVETPHMGMEHQTIIAYGNEYKGNPWGEQFGFDFLHHHEMAHEWWANLVTAENWNDFWIHEGFGTYAQALYVEKLHGAEAYDREMESNRVRILNQGAVAPRDERSTDQMYFSGVGDAPGGDIYFKGSWILHSLRWLVGDEKFFVALRRMAYPSVELEQATDGSQCRFTTTDEIQAIAEQHTGHELDWFFELYLRQPALPELEHLLDGGTLRLAWKTPKDLPFPMPVEVRVGRELHRVEMPGGKGSLDLGRQRDFEIDPRGRVLYAVE